MWINFIHIIILDTTFFFFQVRANATAKATVAAFAAAEGHAHPRVVELPKTEEGLFSKFCLAYRRVTVILYMCSE